jgi:hypothetical protein
MTHRFPLSRIGYLGVIIVLCGLVVFVSGRSEAARFQNRSMFIGSPKAGETTFYQLTFTYPTVGSVGSLRFEFCDNPIPSLPCVVPAGLDIANATLAAQSGETGYSITQQTNSVIVLSRTPSVTGNTVSSYRLDNIVNPSSPTQDFYVRMSDFASTDATGSVIDFGSVTAQLAPSIDIYTQVPPILVFCVAGSINDNDCADTSGNFVDYGELSSGQTHTTTSQILARTNAQYGYSVTVSGRTMTSVTNVISALEVPTESFRGMGQFGLNLVANSQPVVGTDPSGPGVNAAVAADYSQANKYVFRDGDVLISSTGVTPTRRFTTSYIVNVPSDQAPGIYSTTISYLALAGF